VNRYHFLLGIPKSRKIALLRRCNINRNLEANLTVNGQDFIVPHALIQTILLHQISNDFNSLTWWPGEVTNQVLEIFRPYIAAGGSIQTVANVTGIWPRTLKAWGL